MFRSRTRTIATTLALAAGIAVGAAGISAAASNGTPSGTSGNPPNPARVAHGPGETLLSGTPAAKVKAAALAAVPGATVIRVETDSAGAAYEAHMIKADGSDVTVKLDSAFKVTATQSGFGAGPAGAPGAAPTSASNF